MICFLFIELLTPNVGLFLPPTNSPTLWTPAGCSTVGVNSDTNSLEVKGSIPQDGPHLRCQHQVQGAQGTHISFCLTWLQISDSHDPFLRFDNLLEQHTELRKTADLLLLDYYKGYDSGRTKQKRRTGQGMGAVPLPLGSHWNLSHAWAYFPGLFWGLGGQGWQQRKAWARVAGPIAMLTMIPVEQRWGLSSRAV